MLAVFCKPIIAMLFGQRFVPAVQPLLLLLPGVIMLSTSKVLCGDLAGRGKPGYAMMSSVIGLVVNIPCCYFLIPKWGINGAAVASSISYSISAIIVIIAFSRLTLTPYIDFLAIKSEDLDAYKAILRRMRNKLSSKPVADFNAQADDYDQNIAS
jgi:O-antigen/teichoic acid export membrane protein